jgi:hypothetical protein
MTTPFSDDSVRSEYFGWAATYGFAEHSATFGTLTFPRAFHPTGANTVFRAWLRNLGPRIPRSFYGLRAEDRTLANILHYHVVICGLRPAERTIAERAWRTVSGGFSRFAPSTPTRLLYVTKVPGLILDPFGQWPKA